MDSRTRPTDPQHRLRRPCSANGCRSPRPCWLFSVVALAVAAVRAYF